MTPAEIEALAESLSLRDAAALYEALRSKAYKWYAVRPVCAWCSCALHDEGLRFCGLECMSKAAADSPSGAPEGKTKP